MPPPQQGDLCKHTALFQRQKAADPSSPRLECFPIRPDWGESNQARESLRGEQVQRRIGSSCLSGKSEKARDPLRGDSRTMGGSILLGSLGVSCLVFWDSLLVCSFHHFLVLTFEETNLLGRKERKNQEVQWMRRKEMMERISDHHFWNPMFQHYTKNFK